MQFMQIESGVTGLSASVRAAVGRRTSYERRVKEGFRGCAAIPGVTTSCQLEGRASDKGRCPRLCGMAVGVRGDPLRILARICSLPLPPGAAVLLPAAVLLGGGNRRHGSAASSGPADWHGRLPRGKMRGKRRYSGPFRCILGIIAGDEGDCAGGWEPGRSPGPASRSGASRAWLVSG